MRLSLTFLLMLTSATAVANPAPMPSAKGPVRIARKMLAKHRMRLIRRELKNKNFAPSVVKQTLAVLERIAKDGSQYGTFSSSREDGQLKVSATGRNGTFEVALQPKRTYGGFGKHKPVAELKVSSSRKTAWDMKTDIEAIALTPNLTIIGSAAKLSGNTQLGTNLGPTYATLHRKGKEVETVRLQPKRTRQTALGIRRMYQLRARVDQSPLKQALRDVALLE